MHPMQPADQLLHRHMQSHGGVSIDAPSAAGRDTTAQHFSVPTQRETTSSMSFPRPASNLPAPSRIRDRALWDRAQTLLSRHVQSPLGKGCAVPRCADGYPCLPARTAGRLRAASIAPFHQRLTALIDARSCEVLASNSFGLLARAPAGVPGQATMDFPSGDGHVDTAAGTMMLAIHA